VYKYMNCLLSEADRSHLSLMYADEHAYSLTRKIELLKSRVHPEEWVNEPIVTVELLEILYSKFR
jgi:hypothetical protein